MFRSSTSPKRASTLTPTTISIFSSERRTGQLAIGERRDVALADVDDAKTSRAKPLGIGKALVTMKLSTRSSFERSSIHFASLERLAAGITALKAGRTVEPFLRMMDDLAAMRAAEAKAAGREPPKTGASTSNAARHLVRDGIGHLALKGPTGSARLAAIKLPIDVRGHPVQIIASAVHPFTHTSAVRVRWLATASFGG